MQFIDNADRFFEEDDRNLERLELLRKKEEEKEYNDTEKRDSK